MTRPGHEHDDETLTGATGAPEKPKGETAPVESEAEKLAHGGGVDVGDVAREYLGSSRETAEEDSSPRTS